MIALFIAFGFAAVVADFILAIPLLAGLGIFQAASGRTLGRLFRKWETKKMTVEIPQKGEVEVVEHFYISRGFGERFFECSDGERYTIKDGWHWQKWNAKSRAWEPFEKLKIPITIPW